jgi:hypothetical protein
VEGRDTLASLLPQTIALQRDAWSLDEAHTHTTLCVPSAQTEARCPACAAPARHVHRHDTRTLADLPWSGDGISWRLRVRQLFCRHPACSRRLFTERRPGLVAPWARRTWRLTARLLAIGLALGGAAGVRLSQSFGLPVSRNPLLRVIRRAPCPAISVPRVLSAGEFAPRRRHTYGTLLLDLARRRHTRPARGGPGGGPMITRPGGLTSRAGPWAPSRSRWASGGAPCSGTLQRPAVPERQPRHGRDRSRLDPDKATLLAGWNHRCRNGAHLFRMTQGQGFQGRYGMVALCVRRLRPAQAQVPRPRRSDLPLPLVTAAPPRPLTPRRAGGSGGARAGLRFPRPPASARPP